MVQIKVISSDAEPLDTLYMTEEMAYHLLYFGWLGVISDLIKCLQNQCLGMPLERWIRSISL